MARYINDGSTREPRLLVYLNEDNLTDLRAYSAWPGLSGADRVQRLLADGFEGLQVTGADLPPAGSMPTCGCDRISTPDEADPVVARHAGRGDVGLTVHAGWGIEDDDDVFRLVEAILAASERNRIPVFVETHRSTITQDMWRTVRIVERFPELLLNGDFSHFYTGQEMVYGGMERKLAFMAPIFARTGFMHGRISSPGCMQVPVEDLQSRPVQAHGEIDYLEHYREMWTLAMEGFLRAAGPGDVLVFAPELLSGRYYYARLFPDAAGRLVEESDRYEQALLYQRIARACFAAAQERLARRSPS